MQGHEFLKALLFEAMDIAMDNGNVKLLQALAKALDVVAKFEKGNTGSTSALNLTVTKVHEPSEE